MAISQINNNSLATGAVLTPAMGYSGAPIKISTYTNSTRQVTSSAATYTAFTWTFTKLYGTTTNVIVQGNIPGHGNTNDVNNWFINIDGTYQYTGTAATDTAAESQSVQVLQVWTGLAAGSHTVTFGWNVGNGTANRDMDVINPNSTDDARYQQNGSVFILTEVIA
jgi:hypothetical protein